MPYQIRRCKIKLRAEFIKMQIRPAIFAVKVAVYYTVDFILNNKFCIFAVFASYVERRKVHHTNYLIILLYHF